MKLVEKYPILGSSQNPQKLSLTIKSVGLALVPVILAIMKMSGLEAFTENDLVVIVNSLATIVATIGVIYGIFRKLKK